MFINPSKKSVKIINDSQIFNCRDMDERRNRSSYQEKEEEKQKEYPQTSKGVFSWMNHSKLAWTTKQEQPYT